MSPAQALAVALLAALLATDLAAADIGIALGYGRGGGGGGGGGAGAGGPPQPYSFQYAVQDAATRNDFGQRESGDAAGAVRGEYRVLLPDGRRQVVTYSASDAQGYVADVQYEGAARPPSGGGAAGGRAPAGGSGAGAHRGYRK